MIQTIKTLAGKWPTAAAGSILVAIGLFLATLFLLILTGFMAAADLFITTFRSLFL